MNGKTGWLGFMQPNDPPLKAVLAQTMWDGWLATPIAQDASTRQYWRLSKGDQTVILMLGGADTLSTQRFIQMALALRESGLSAPNILHHDPDQNMLILEDLGSNDVAGWCSTHKKEEPAIYEATVDLLLSIETVKPPENLPVLTPGEAAKMVGLLNPYCTDHDVTGVQDAVLDAMQQLCPAPDTLALRDFHAENLIWRGERQGLDRIGLLDFQDAFIAPAGYDFVSLIKDARRDIPPTLQDALTDKFLQRTRQRALTRSALAILSVQRNLRILAVFNRLAKNSGKSKYLAFLPRVWAHIQTDLKDPALAPLAKVINQTLKPPVGAVP